MTYFRQIYKKLSTPAALVGTFFVLLRGKEKKSVSKEPLELLESIEYPRDLRRLTPEQLPQLCRELRTFLIRELCDNPGHLASSLGAVELTVALHYVFDTPEDRIVWDVGHQAYGHKILTGRRKLFHENRKMDGLRPFPSPEESEYDTNTCGHASNSISVALGLAVAAEQQHIDRHVVAVIGDGSMSGGLAFEGLNNVSSTPNNMLIILNDNNMSIDSAVGGLKQYLHNLHTSSLYNELRNKAALKLGDWGWMNDQRRRSILRFNNSLKSLLQGQRNIFEGLDIRYFGPEDGHDVVQLVETLRRIKDMKGPRLLHIRTTKGKGYEPAEKNPTVFHAPGRFNPETGERIKGDAEGLPPRFQDVFGHTLLALAKEDSRICGITPAMPTGCSMNILMKEMPDRAFDVGIAEGHAVTFAAGMALDGLIPFCNIYSSFAQRAYDNIIHDVAISRLHVVLCLDRAGLVGEDGATHHGAFDLAALRPIPSLTICSPLDENDLEAMMRTAAFEQNGPFVIRYPRGRRPGKATAPHPAGPSEIGHGRCLKEGRGKTAILTLGPIGNIALEAAEGTDAAVWDMRYLKPLDESILRRVAEEHERIVTVEDGVRNGGLGSAVTEWMNDRGYNIPVVRLGLPDSFVGQGTPQELYRLTGLDPDNIKQQIQ